MDIATRQRKERAIWDRNASGYDRMNMNTYEDAYRKTTEKVLAQVSSEDLVLEIGCGTGIMSSRVAPHVKKLVAVDISPAMVQVAKEKMKSLVVNNVECEVYDGYHLPQDCETFDAILLFNIVQCVKEPETLINESYRLLKNGGKLFIAADCYAELVPPHIRLMLMVQKLMKFIGVYPFVQYFKKEDIRRLVRNRSFEILDEDVMHPAPQNFYLMAVKKLST